jgi:uncharacterized beta-barrel protein YwiB (DUF1934 family)
MNIQARRTSGSTFSAEDKLEVTFNSDNQPMASVVHTVELISGSNVTHGGGGQPDEYLHYKATERDADNDGIIDYSDIEMALIQEEQGTSVIKVKCGAVTKADVDASIAEVEAWIERKGVAEGLDEEFTEVAPTFEPTILTTGEITLEWSDDNFV